MSVASRAIGFKNLRMNRQESVRSVGFGPIAGTGKVPYSRPMNLNYLIGLLCFIFWIVALVDCIRSNIPNKVLWIVLIILLPFLGTILYFILGKTRAV